MRLVPVHSRIETLRFLEYLTPEEEERDDEEYERYTDGEEGRYILPAAEEARHFLVRRVEQDREDDGERQDRKERREDEKEEYRDNAKKYEEGKTLHFVLIHIVQRSTGAGRFLSYLSVIERRTGCGPHGAHRGYTMRFLE